MEDDNIDSEGNQDKNSEQIEDENTLIEIEEYAPEIRDVYKGIKVLKDESEPSKKEDNKEDPIIKNIPRVLKDGSGSAKKEDNEENPVIKNIPIIKDGSGSIDKEDNKKNPINKNIPKRKKIEKRRLSKVLEESSINVPVIACKVILEKFNLSNLSEMPAECTDLNLNEVSLNEPSPSKAVEVEILPNKDVPEDSSLLNSRPRKYGKRSKRIKLSEEYLLQNCPDVLRRSQRIKDKKLKENQLLKNSFALKQNFLPCSLSSEIDENSNLIENSTLIQNSSSIQNSTSIGNSSPVFNIFSETQKKKSVLHKVIKERRKRKKHYFREPIEKRKFPSEAPTSFESLYFINGKRYYAFRWIGGIIINDIPEENLTEPMKILVKSHLRSTLEEVNNPLYYKPGDDTSNNSHEITASTNASVSSVGCFGFDQTINTIMQYKNKQQQMLSEFIDSKRDTTPLDIDVKFHIE